MKTVDEIFAALDDLDAPPGKIRVLKKDWDLLAESTQRWFKLYYGHVYDFDNPIESPPPMTQCDWNILIDSFLEQMKGLP